MKHSARGHPWRLRSPSGGSLAGVMEWEASGRPIPLLQMFVRSCIFGKIGCFRLQPSDILTLHVCRDKWRRHQCREEGPVPGGADLPTGRAHRRMCPRVPATPAPPRGLSAAGPGRESQTTRPSPRPMHPFSRLSRQSRLDHTLKERVSRQTSGAIDRNSLADLSRE